jgi:hypothetical protein
MIISQGATSEVQKGRRLPRGTCGNRSLIFSRTLPMPKSILLRQDLDRCHGCVAAGGNELQKQFALRIRL